MSLITIAPRHGALRTPGTTANRWLMLLVLLLALTNFSHADIFIECAGLMDFLDQPRDVAACSGQSPVISARIRPAFAEQNKTGGGSYFVSKPHTIYWRWYGTNIPGATYVISSDPPEGPVTISFTLTNATSVLNGFYDVVVSNACNYATSQVARVSIGPSIITSPQSITGQVAQAVSLTVGTFGPGTLHYQWRLDGSNLVNSPYVSGAQSNQITLNPLLYSLDGNYDVVVRDECPVMISVTSAVARVTVAPRPQWVLRATNGPSPRYANASAYDSLRKVTVLFGGGIISGGLYAPFGDLWEWNGNRWISRLPHSPTNGWSYIPATGGWRPTYGDSPVPRLSHVLAFDSRRGRTVLFGGRTTTPGGFDLFLNDTWEWDGLRWYFRATNGPSPRVYPSMAYDSDRGVTVMSGGFIDGPNSTAIWEWDGNSWSAQSPTNGPSSYSQNSANMAYDSFRRRTFFGPTEEGNTPMFFWDWDGVNWTLRGQGYTPLIRSPAYAGMAFDSYRRRVVTFGGTYFVASSQTWSWDGGQWEQLQTTPVPSARSYVDMAYDSARHVIVLMGGMANNSSPLGDTWELQEVDTPLINDQPASQYRQPGETATFAVTASGPGTLTYQWKRNGMPLTDGGRISGTITTNLTISNVDASDAANYSVEVTNICGSTLSLPAILTLDLNIQIFSSANTVTLVWAASNVVLEQASAVTGPWTVVPGATTSFERYRPDIPAPP